ncbi:hypothetical protein OG215_36215 (plasmid) [Streptomyces globisporus]|uniref:hypothetical protein n=1 Tax=Streptomyces globisporus TaxID=1908 RepID=UPI002F90FB1C|nr:hypothetical protein OG215_36215 [Streptomyces globisporus]
MIFVDASIAEDDPGRASFGSATRGIVDESQGGLIAYVHADLAPKPAGCMAQHYTTVRG